VYIGGLSKAGCVGRANLLVRTGSDSTEIDFGYIYAPDN